MIAAFILLVLGLHEGQQQSFNYNYSSGTITRVYDPRPCNSYFMCNRYVVVDGLPHYSLTSWCSAKRSTITAYFSLRDVSDIARYLEACRVDT